MKIFLAVKILRDGIASTIFLSIITAQKILQQEIEKSPANFGEGFFHWSRNIFVSGVESFGGNVGGASGSLNRLDNRLIVGQDVGRGARSVAAGGVGVFAEAVVIHVHAEIVENLVDSCGDLTDIANVDFRRRVGSVGEAESREQLGHFRQFGGVAARHVVEFGVAHDFVLQVLSSAIFIILQIVFEWLISFLPIIRGSSSFVTRSKKFFCVDKMLRNAKITLWKL